MEIDYLFLIKYIYDKCWATDWMIGGSSPGWGWEFSSLPPRPDRLWNPPSLLSNGYEGLLHLVPRSKNEWNYTSTPPVRLSWRGA
jgi:hypothetical protein